MSPEERELRQRIAALAEEARALFEEDKTTEARSKLDKAKALKELLKVEFGVENDESDSRSNETLVPVDEMYGATQQQGGQLILKKEQRMADNAKPFIVNGEKRQLSIGKYVRGIVTGNWKDAESEKRAMSEGVLSSGGYMVPDLLSSQVIDLARNQARVIQAGAVTVPMESNKLTLAKVLNGPKVGWKAENATIVESNDTTLGAINLEAKTLVGMMRFSIELLEDAANIDSIISNELSASLSLELDRAALFGSGADDEPLGLYNTPGVQKIDMGANGAAIEGYNKFSEAVEYVRNVNGEATGIILSPRTAGAIDRLADSTGQPLKAPASYETLAKYSTNQVPLNQVKGTAKNASVSLVGDWSQLLIGARTNLMLEASREAAGAFEKMQVVVRAYLRADIAVAKADHFVAIDGIIPA
ncbi:phage major capsid protein [Paenibacillus macquariensis]|uniref:Phage major capsid protein, HK97 family n=1 Tax=Paenibacillus macquariensis TaxID=948756 RepID=A0ABY1KGW2_9BACL|nr:phage major capsid protein [Paenibacillus macquariensis]OAB27856.1 hypothetical protein PMSM_24490 [Paenibacillus macquariensis subsp. macquariensis]SIR72430.1 phage major capsid protein, HK97 family [Paenibacillus macquariensis]